MLFCSVTTNGSRVKESMGLWAYVLTVWISLFYFFTVYLNFKLYYSLAQDFK